MTAREFGVLADAIKTYFPRDNVLPTEHALKLWYMELKDIPYEMAYTALRRYASTSCFAPTIADIRMGVAEIRDGEVMNESEAWDIVMRAVKRSAWHSEEEFKKLPAVIKRVVRSPQRLLSWALDENFNQGVESSNFQRAFRIEQEKEFRNRSLSPDIQRIIQSLMEDDSAKEIGESDKPQIESKESREDAVSNGVPERLQGLYQKLFSKE